MATNSSPNVSATPISVRVLTQTPAPHHGTSASKAVYQNEWQVGWLLLALVIGAAIGGTVTQLLSKFGRTSAFRFASWVGFFVGVIGAIGHIVFVDLRSDEKFIPIFDETTLLWAAVAIVALLVPFISEFSFGGASFKLVETTKAAEDVVEKVTDLTQNWTKQIAQFLAELETGIVGDAFAKSLLSFLQLRSYEALEWLGGDGEKRRLSLWLYDKRTDELGIFFSDGIADDETKNARIKRGVGIVGTVYKLQQTWNERDAPALGVWIPIRSTAPRYLRDAGQLR